MSYSPIPIIRECEARIAEDSVICMTCFHGEDFYIVVFWVITSFSLIYGCERLRGTCFVKTHDRSCALKLEAKKAPRKLRSPTTRLHGVTNPEDGRM
jgi:hypothetical protein